MSRIHTLLRPNSKKAFFLATGLLVVMFVSYVSFVNSTVMNVVARERMQRQIASISSSMGDLEFKYSTLKNNVSLDVAYEKGFVEINPSSFLAQGKIPSLSYNYSR